MRLIEEPGITGHFTREHAPGAMENGTVGYKINSMPGDAHQDGSPCVVLGSLRHPSVGLGYFVAWQDMPLHAVFVVEKRLRFYE